MGDFKLMKNVLQFILAALAITAISTSEARSTTRLRIGDNNEFELKFLNKDKLETRLDYGDASYFTLTPRDTESSEFYFVPVIGKYTYTNEIIGSTARWRDNSWFIVTFHFDPRERRMHVYYSPLAASGYKIDEYLCTEITN